jgi:hypothetical protein
VAIPLRQTLPQQVIVDVETVGPAPGHRWKLQRRQEDACSLGSNR